MPIYTLQGPDGKTYKIEGPAGANVDQLTQAIRSRAAPAPMNLDPTEGMSTGDKFFAGVGKAMVDTARGIGQLIPESLGGVTREDVAEARKLDSPLMKTGAGMAGNLAGNIAVTAPTMFIPGVNTAKGAALLGTGMGLLQPSTSASETAFNTLVGGAAGYGGQKIGQAIGRGLGGNANADIAAIQSAGKASAKATASGTPTATAKGKIGFTFGSVDTSDVGGLTNAQQLAAKRGKDLGFKLSPGQSSGSKSLQQLEAKLESQPMTSGPFNTLKEGNQLSLNRVAAKSIGVDADNLGSDVLGVAQDKISRVYNIVANDTPRKIDADSFINGLKSVDDEFSGLLYKPTGDAMSVVDNPLVKRLYDLASNGEATGRQLQDLASKLGKTAADNMTSANGNRQLGMALFKAKELADDILEQGLNGRTKDMFAQARGNYRNLMLLTSRQGVVNPSNGNVSGNALASALQGKDKRGFLFGKNGSDLYDAARFAQAFKPIVGDSGTATRSVLPNGVLEAAASIPFNLASRAYLSSPVTAMAGASGRGAMPSVMTPEKIKALSTMTRMGLLGSANSME
jgi:hypothetical protein